LSIQSAAAKRRCTSGQLPGQIIPPTTRIVVTIIPALRSSP
jgi:hypothetical protein